MASNRARSRSASIPGFGKRDRGVQRLRRPATETGPAFDIGYVRTGPRGATPILVLPGGPGVASIRMYPAMRAAAAARGLDVLMADHRGVANSRRDLQGNDLPPEAITLEAAIDDLAALLDAEKIDRVVVTGASYGTTLAQGFGVRYPGRVAGMVLDSTVLSAEDHHEVRRYARSKLWEGEDPALSDLAAKIRILVQRDGRDPVALGDTVRLMYEFGGRDLLERYLEQEVRGQATVSDSVVAGLLNNEVLENAPGLMEFDLVGRIAFHELNYHPEPDGLIFDPSPPMARPAASHPPFGGEPFDFPAELPGFTWLTAVVSGARDLRTPRPVAERTASLLADGVLVPVTEMGHSALDTHFEVFIEVAEAVRDGDRTRLAELARTGCTGLRRRGTSGLLGPILRTVLTAEKPLAPLLRLAKRR